MKRRRKFQKQSLKLAKGLTRAEAFAKARKKAAQDFRGFTYDTKTGKASLI